MVCFPQIPFLSTVRFSPEKNNVSMMLKKAALSKNSGDKLLWINIVYGVKIHNIMFIL